MQQGIVSRALAAAIVLTVSWSSTACWSDTRGVTAPGRGHDGAVGSVAGSAGGQEPVAVSADDRLEATYGGLGTWIDIYDRRAWKQPRRTVRAISRHGIRAIYLQTSNYSRSRPFVDRDGVEAFLDAAARHHVRVVAWYLPGFRDLATDLRRARAAIHLTTAKGHRFDSFALDIESPEVRRQGARTRRLLALSARIRRSVGPEYRLGAIVPSPQRVRLDRTYWPSFPYRRLARLYDVFLPMTYFTWRAKGRDGAFAYTARNISIIRRETAGLDVPIHVIGGIASDATVPETRGFVDTIADRGVLGASYYTFPLIGPDLWKALDALR